MGCDIMSKFPESTIVLTLELG